jgi:hypothetical protein
LTPLSLSLVRPLALGLSKCHFPSPFALSPSKGGTWRVAGLLSIKPIKIYRFKLSGPFPFILRSFDKLMIQDERKMRWKNESTMANKDAGRVL